MSEFLLISVRSCLGKCLYRSVTKSDPRRPVFRALNTPLMCPGLVGGLLCFPRHNSGCSAPPHHPKTSEESGRTSATPTGCRVGLGSGIAAETHLLGASVGTS